MKQEEDFRVRPGRIRSRGDQRARRFIGQALAATEKAGGRFSGGRVPAKRGSIFGRGRAASVGAMHRLTPRSRGAVIKARVVRQRPRSAALTAHLGYLRREGVTRDGSAGRMFDATRDDCDHRRFVERCEGDRHHFRFIVSPDDALELDDLKGFTCDLMRNVEHDLGSKLDWIAIDHWNTEHPHVHVIVRGRADDGHDLVISRDYISEGMRARAQDLLTQELGPRTDHDIRRSLEAQIERERWTELDRELAREADQRDGVVDLTRSADGQPDAGHALKVGRMRKLERLGLATPIRTNQWLMDERAETALRELGSRNDIVKRIHRGLAERGGEGRGTAGFVLASESLDEPIAGRLLARGLDDELKGTAYAVIDGVDGRTHHVRLADLDAVGDAAPGSIVELRRFEDARGRQHAALAVRSDVTLEKQVTASGATWLDQQLVAGFPLPIGRGGFGAEVREALDARIDHLTAEGLARRQGQRLIFARDLLDTLRRRELKAAGAKLSAETGLTQGSVEAGDAVAGMYRQRVVLASGRFAMIDDGLGFSLVPWTPALEKHLGQHVSGVAKGDGGIAWSFSRTRGREI